MHNENYNYIPLNDQANYFYTSDFALSVTLQCKGFKLITIEREGAFKYTFVFNRSEQSDYAIDDYWSHRIQIDPLDYENYRKNLKSRIANY